MSIFAEAAAELADALADEAGELVTYARGGSASTITAVCGSSHETMLDQAGNLLAVRHRDWIIKRTALTLGEPRIGDRITRADGTVWEVCPTADQRGFRDSDNHGVAWRIHTKRVT